MQNTVHLAFPAEMCKKSQATPRGGSTVMLPKKYHLQLLWYLLVITWVTELQQQLATAYSQASPSDAWGYFTPAKQANTKT